MQENVPDNWGSNHECGNCGGYYHPSEGGCDCRSFSAELALDETVFRLQNPKCTLDAMDKEEEALKDLEDDCGQYVYEGFKLYRLYITEDGHPEELVFSEESWEAVKKELGLLEDPPSIWDE